MSRLFNGAGDSGDYTAAAGGGGLIEGAGTVTGTGSLQASSPGRLAGSYYQAAQGGTATSEAYVSWTIVGGALNRSYYLRAFVSLLSPLQANAFDLCGFAGSFRARYKGGTVVGGSAKLALFTSGGVQVGSESADYPTFVTTGGWDEILLRVRHTAGAADQAEFYLNGVLVASTTTGNESDAAPTAMFFGVRTVGNLSGASSTIKIDDVALNDDQGASQNTWPPFAAVALLLPVSDNSAGSWRAGSAGSAAANGALFEAINNTPPAGTASPDAVGACISNAISGATAPNGDFNMKTLDAYGLKSGRPTVAQMVVVHGEDISTGAKTGTFAVLSNPAQGAADNVADGGSSQFGPSGGGAVGAYPTNWRASLGSMIYNPAMTIPTAPVCRITKTDTGTRAADLAFMGLFVEVDPTDMLPLPASSPGQRARMRL